MSSITTADGLQLEARWDRTAGHAEVVTVLCHPHPLDRGTMNAPLMREVAARLAAAGSHVLRFNFRGVGLSEGTWGGGRDEIGDVAAGVEAASLAYPDLPVGLAGWSFGATVGLQWQIATGSTIPWVGIAPGIRPYRGSRVPDPALLEPAPRLIIIGDRDQFATVAEMTSFGERAGAGLHVLAGSDHFFVFRETAVGELVADHLVASAR